MQSESFSTVKLLFCILFHFLALFGNFDISYDFSNGFDLSSMGGGGGQYPFSPKIL